MTPLRRLFILCLAVASPALSPSEQRAEESAVPLTWEDCVRRAERQNPDLISARKSLEGQQSRYRGSLNNVLPQVTLSNSYSNSDNSTGASRWQAQGSVRLDLLNLKNYSTISKASISVKQSSAALRIQSSELRYSLRKAFADLLTTQEEVVVSEKICEIRRSNARTVSLKYESGRESKGNMLKAKAELAQAEASLAQARRSLRANQQVLNRQLGQGDFAAVAVTGTLGVPVLPVFSDPDSLVGRHPQIDSLEASRSLAKESLSEARSDLWPTLSASYSRSTSDRSYFPSDNYHWNVSGVLSLPLFGGGPTATYHAVSAAKRDAEKAEENLRAKRYQIRSELESSWADLAGKIDQVHVQQQFLEAARQRNSEALVRYSSGLMSFEEWELVVAELVSYERSVIQSRQNAAIAEAAWYKALGSGLEE
ncbi:MAG TPA: TolC family protein [Elusimicrobiota bacterium]|nr:TolC family protein [Elusimicrobiota bacterium]